MRCMRYQSWRSLSLCLLMLLSSASVSLAQPMKSYTVKNGRMYVQLEKGIRLTALDSFVSDFDLRDLGLFSFIKFGKKDSLQKQGWNIEVDNEIGFVISKAFEPFNADQISKDIFTKNSQFIAMFPSVNNGLAYGVKQVSRMLRCDLL